MKNFSFLPLKKAKTKKITNKNKNLRLSGVALATSGSGASFACDHLKMVANALS